MGLTSPALMAVVAVVAAAALAAILWYWPRLAGRGVLPVVARIGALGVLQLSVLGLIFLIVNSSAEFYSSWSDLFGSDTTSASVMTSSSAAAARIRPVVVTGHAVVRVPGDRAATGTLESVRLTGELSGLTVPGDVFLPAGYRDGGPVGQYPVTLVISSDIASTSSAYGAIRLAQTAARLIAARQLDPMIMVMLPAGLAPSDQGCLNEPPHEASAGVTASPAILASTFFSEDVPAIMESSYAASNRPADWALLGDTSGGYCALQLALNNSWVFSAAAVPDGDYTAPPGAAGSALSPQLKQQDNLLWLMRTQPMQPVSVLFTGPSFRSGAGKAQPYLTLARRPMHVTTAALGGGNWPLSNVLSWIGGAIGVHSQAIAG